MSDYYKSNEYWSQLCKLTDKLVAEYGSRPAAFEAACRLRPDWARVAINPEGRPIDYIHGLPAAPATSQEAIREPKAVSAGSVLVAAAERLAAEHNRRLSPRKEESRDVL